MIIKIFETLEGGVCALSFQGHLSFFDGEKFNTVRPNLPEDTVRGMTGVLQDRTGEWWVGSFLGLYRFPKVDDFHQLARVAPSASYRLMNGFPSDTINSLFEDSRGGIWVSFFGQQKEVLVRWERTSGVFQPFTAADGLPQGTALDNFCEDGNGNLWMTGRGGQLLRYRNGRFGEISLPITRKVGSLSSLYIDSKNRVWICTANDGLQRIDDPSADAPTITRLTIQEGLSSNSINYAVEDDLGRLYVVTSRGMDRLDPDSGQIKQYTREDGLVSTTSGMAIRDKHGVLWLATRRGISRYTPARDKLTSPAPTYIKSVLISGRSIPVSEIGETDIHDVVIEPGELQFQIDFFALSLAAGETLRYQYKLEGADIDWTTPTNQRVVSFPNMAPGSYRFLVRAVLTDGTTTSSPASLSFVVLRPIWQRWWFVAIFLGLVGMLVYVFYRYRVARLLELERVRTRIATDLHDDIGASLSRMAILSEVVKHQTGSLNLTTFQMLTEIADSARSLVDSMSDIVWSIDPRKDDLKSVAQRVRQFASDVLEARHIAWSFETPADIEKIKLPPDERRQLFLIFKEAVTNIAKHSGGSEARLCLRVEGGRLVAEIGDNGCGFAQPDPEISFNGLGGNGLKNMRARASDVGGCLDVDSQPGTGSLIRFILPMKKLSLRGS